MRLIFGAVQALAETDVTSGCFEKREEVGWDGNQNKNSGVERTHLVANGT